VVVDEEGGEFGVVTGAEGLGFEVRVEFPCAL
jgi:hypothetical protein